MVLGRNLAPIDGELYYTPAFYDRDEAAEMFSRLAERLDWQAESIRIAGRTVSVPRLVCWYGDAGAEYRYSGLTHRPSPWTDDLSALRRRVEAFCDRPFNSVLGNFYRDGKDSMGWHADREPELGQNPWIASVSFGDTRQFQLRHPRSDERLALELESGSLLLMGGALQHHWRHCLPKTKRPVGARVNLTFRWVMLTGC